MLATLAAIAMVGRDTPSESLAELAWADSVPVEVSGAPMPEAKLAAIDLGYRDVPADRVVPYADALDQLQGECDQDRERIADYVVTGVDLVRRKGGIEPSNLEFLRAMAGSMAGANDIMTCAEAAAALVALISEESP